MSGDRDDISAVRGVDSAGGDSAGEGSRERALRRRREAQRARLRNRRRWTAAVVFIALAAVALAAAFGGGSKRADDDVRTQASAAASTRPAAVVPGGPLAPAGDGGLAALWAPRNVVGAQPGTAAAYEAASTRPGLPGYLLIADRGNNRILVVDPHGRVVWRYPTAADLAAGRRLFYNDDTFVEPGGGGLIANEEDNHAIVQIGLADHSLRVLFGHPGEVGSDGTHLHTPDDAYMLPSGTFTVADAYNCRILFVRGHRIVRHYGRSGDCRHEPPRYLGAVNGDTPDAHGGVLISEIAGTGSTKSPPTGVCVRGRGARRLPLRPAAAAGRPVLLADYSSPGHVLIIDRHGRVLWRYGPDAGIRARGPPLAGDGPAQRRHRRQRRLPRPRDRDRPEEEPHRMEVRPHRSTRQRAGLPEHTGRHGLHPRRPQRPAGLGGRGASVAMGTPRAPSGRQPSPAGRQRATLGRRARRRRAGALLGLLLVAIVVAVLLGGGGKSPPGTSAHGDSATGSSQAGASGGSSSTGAALARVRMRVVQSGMLATAEQDAAAVVESPSSFLLLGGIDAGESSLSSVVSVGTAGAEGGAWAQAQADAHAIGTLPTALHDACASFSAGAAYLFGGGVVGSFAQITRIDASGASRPAGQLPTPASDVACATIAETVYIVGGYTGVAPLRTILAWRPGAPAARVAGVLPRPLRYAAVAAVGGQLVIAGGTSGETASRNVYRFDPATGRLASIGLLPRALTHAAAAALAGTMFVFGGRGSSPSSATRRILAIAPGGEVRQVGLLPFALSDLAAVAQDGHIVLAGGRDAGGGVHGAILTATVAAG